MSGKAKVYFTRVFTMEGGGGNVAPIVLDADTMSDLEMQQVAREHARESAFRGPGDADHDFSLRFWVPNHEMEMCGHATAGTVWLLHRLGMLKQNDVRISTKSGTVLARSSKDPDDKAPMVEISQPQGHIQSLFHHDDKVADILSVLRIDSSQLGKRAIQNAGTSRVKTLIPVKDVATLNNLDPDFDQVEALCESIGSTGLCPYTVVDVEEQILETRQFPKSSGYPEDPATGIAATALAFGALSNGLVTNIRKSVKVRQGRTMGLLSEMIVRFQTATDGNVNGCWLGGEVCLDERPS